MKRIYHVHTPVSRLHNIPKFLAMISTMPVIWHPVFEAHERPELPDEPWIQPMACGPNPPGYFPGHWKGNWFLDHTELNPAEYYVQLNDDDFYAPGFFEHLDKAEGAVLIASMARGRLQDTLLAKPEKLFCGGIGGEQIILRGDVQKDFRYGTGYCGDWDMIAAVTAKHAATFVPEAVVWFNYLERGRWDNVMLPMQYQDEGELAECVGLLRERFSCGESSPSPRHSPPGEGVPLRNVLEIGSMHGDTLAHWMGLMPTGGSVASVDLCVCEQDPRLGWQRQGHEKLWPWWSASRGLRFACFERNSTDPGTVSGVKSFFRGPLDFLFIDGGHDYATAKADWENYSPLVRPGGLVAFHDIGAEWPDVRQFWNEIKGGFRHWEFVKESARFGIGVLVTAH